MFVTYSMHRYTQHQFKIRSSPIQSSSSKEQQCEARQSTKAYENLQRAQSRENDVIYNHDER
eukprot:755388-Hanusia_phi.AAC.3